MLCFVGPARLELTIFRYESAALTNYATSPFTIIYLIRTISTHLSTYYIIVMSLLDDYIYTESADLSELANSPINCHSESEYALTENDIENSTFKLQVLFSKIPYVRDHNGIPVISSLDHFMKTYHQVIEMIFSTNNMFRSWTSPLWQSENSVIGRSFIEPVSDIKAILTYGFELSPTLSTDSVMRFVSQVYQIPICGETNVLIIREKRNSSRTCVTLTIDNNYRGRMFYDSLTRIDLMKNLMRIFTDDERKTNFHRLQESIGRYRHYGRPDGCVNYEDICETKMPWENFEQRSKMRG